ncbi:MAG: endopeptidase La [Paludibacteraceae bacterium]|nr:endopeptidase La [Paludibacteraceae bacterium]
MKTKHERVIIGAVSDNNDDASFIPLIAEENDEHAVQLPEDNILPILALRNMVLFPGVIMPVVVGRKKSLKAVREMYKQGKPIGAVAQRDKNTENPKKEDLFQVGTIAQIVRILEMPDNTTTVILQGKQTFLLNDIVGEEPYLSAQVELRNEVTKVPKSKHFTALVAAIKDLAMRMIRLSGNMPQEIMFAIRNIESAQYTINFIAANLGLDLSDRQQLLEIGHLEERAYLLLKMLTQESQMLEIKSSIQSQAMENIDKQQREYFLQQQIKTIQKELGGSAQEQDVNQLKQKAAKKKWSDAVKAQVEKEITKLEGMPAHSPDFSVQMNYVQTLVNLPWNEYTKDNFNLKTAERVLNKDHFGLDDVKERILEHLAVLKLRGDLKSPIICLYGPPGVGKTSLGKSVAEALGRKYARISLGGLHDESEIRGHRRTYLGAMPGRIIQSLEKVGSSNPVFILDEIDKIGSDFKGDPSSALLEVLDPEQNNAFHDNYIDIDFDLSKVLFIATANDLSTVSRPLLDRMELINISGYIVEEKIEIATKHLIPKQWENHGIATKAVQVPKKTIRAIVEGYTRESGVRGLDKLLAKIARKAARKTALDETFTITLQPTDLYDYLGVAPYDASEQSQKEEIGIVTGLAWTSVGGEILEIETSLSKGKGDKLTLTGNLGDVMKESATLGLEYIRAHQSQLGVAPDFFETHNIHIHVPEGAIPKDGPSAGITIATSLLSAITGKKVRKHLAMTGEITLHGKVLPVGGIKEKILAAKRAGVTDIMLCYQNRKNIEEIKDIYLKGLTFHYVKNVEEVFKFALL